MFLLVSGRHVGAHVHGHQHGGSIQISINLGKTFLRISSMRKIAVTWILARDFAYVSSFYFQILDLIYWTVLIFYFDLFWMAWHWKPAIKWAEWPFVKFSHRRSLASSRRAFLYFFARCFLRCAFLTERLEEARWITNKKLSKMDQFMATSDLLSTYYEIKEC